MSQPVPPRGELVEPAVAEPAVRDPQARGQERDRRRSRHQPEAQGTGPGARRQPRAASARIASPGKSVCSGPQGSESRRPAVGAPQIRLSLGADRNERGGGREELHLGDAAMGLRMLVEHRQVGLGEHGGREHEGREAGPAGHEQAALERRSPARDPGRRARRQREREAVHERHAEREAEAQLPCAH